MEVTCVPEHKICSDWKKREKALERFLKHHPIIGAITGVGLGALAVSSLRSLATSTKLTPERAVIVGGISTVGSFVFSKLFHLWKHIPKSLVAVPLLKLAGIRHRTGMGDRSFISRECRDKKTNTLLGKIHYEDDKNGNFPVLELYTKDPYAMGYVQGMMLAPQIEDMFHRVVQPMIYLTGALTGHFTQKTINRRIDTLRFPPGYSDEIRGLLSALKDHATITQHPIPSITERDLKKLHIMADVHKAIACRDILGVRGFSILGCSTVAIKSEGRIILGRNLDWPGFGLLGTLVIKRRHPYSDPTTGKVRTIEILTFPGYLGALTASNDDGLAVIVNECGSTGKVTGTPHSFFARELVEQNSSLKQAKEFIADRAQHPHLIPASSHNLIVSDTTDAVVFQFLRDENSLSYSARGLDNNGRLIVTNHALDADGNVIKRSIANDTSVFRYRTLQATLEQSLKDGKTPYQAVKEGLKSVSVIYTIMSVIYDMGRRTSEYVHDNFFAADHHTT